MQFKKKNAYNPRKSDVITLQEGIEELLKLYKLKGKFNKTNIIASWERIMGKTVSSRTERLFFRDETLFVKITSAPLKHQLSMQKSKAIERINTELGEKLVEDIVFL